MTVGFVGKGFILSFCDQFIAVIYSEVFRWWPIFWFTDERMWDYHLITNGTNNLTISFVDLFRILDYHLHRSHNLTTSNSVWRDNDTFWHRSMCLGTGGEIGEPLAQPITIITKTIHNLTNFTTLWKTPNDTFWHRSMHFGRGMRRDPIAPDLPPGPPPKTQVFFFL